MVGVGAGGRAEVRERGFAVDPEKPGFRVLGTELEGAWAVCFCIHFFMESVGSGSRTPFERKGGVEVSARGTLNDRAST